MPAPSDQADIILVFGGAGAIDRHLSRLVKLDLPVLVIPADSGNDFARALRFRRVRDSLPAWRRFGAGQDNIRAIDLGIITSLEAAPGATRVSPVFLQRGRSRARRRSVPASTRFAALAKRSRRLCADLGRTPFRFAPLLMKIFATDQAGGWMIPSQQPTLRRVAFANTAIYGGG
jgi:Diacylglycerol kinase catalytic domain